MKTGTNMITEEKSNGRIYTPLYIVENILDLSGYDGPQILQKHVIDNSCGDGAFLCEIVRRYCKEAVESNASKDDIKNQLSIFVHGIEIDEAEQKKCVANVSEVAKQFNIEDVSWDIICADTLQIHSYDGRMDFVIGNPPYVRVHNLGDSFDDIKKFTFSQGGMTDLFIVFYEIGIRMLSKTGVLGYITPSSFFNSLAGSFMRKTLIYEGLIKKIVDLKHYQAFNAMTYTTIVVLSFVDKNREMEYYQYDGDKQKPYFVDILKPEDYYISDSFYFSSKDDLDLLKKIFFNLGKSDILVKNGYATLCDNVFIGDFSFESEHIIPVIKSSKGIKKKIIYPYNKNGRLIDEEELKKDEPLYNYLLSMKSKLIARSNEKDADKFWYAFGRSQALLDTFKDKVTINTLIRDASDFKFVEAPAGTGVYSGLYLISSTIAIRDIQIALTSDEFIRYVSLLGKYKSGGYYTFSSKDVKTYLDYKFAYDGGIFQC